MNTIKQVRERPIPFSARMVRAILVGRKTQTRRVINPQPFNRRLGYMMIAPSVATLCGDDYPDGDNNEVRCPYGAPGDQLWVREDWCVDSKHDSVRAGDLYPRPDGHGITVIYADNTTREIDGMTVAQRPAWPGRRRWSNHMPRWASRITLELTQLRVERLQEISERDAEAEGAESEVDEAWLDVAEEEIGRSYRVGFRQTWDALNERRGFGWGVSPWVWAITFKRIGP